jgi:hypothetical protein
VAAPDRRTHGPAWSWKNCIYLVLDIFYDVIQLPK